MNETRPDDEHPEELLEAARHGRLSADRAAILEAHAAECPVCAMELRAAVDFAAIPLHMHDAAAVERIVSAARPRVERVERAAPARRRRVLGVPAWAAAAAALLIAASAALAAAWLIGRSDARPGVAAPARHSTRARSSAPDVAPSERAPTAAAAAPATQPSEPRAHRPREPSAEELLARADDARRAHRLRDAATIYRSLQRRYPASREQRVSRIALGRLLLDELRDSRGALAEFDRYLARDRDGPLAEEARVGRALALAKLGRARRERAAWEDLLRHHPQSAYADHARERIRATAGD